MKAIDKILGYIMGRRIMSQEQFNEYCDTLTCLAINEIEIMKQTADTDFDGYITISEGLGTLRLLAGFIRKCGKALLRG